MVRRHYPSGVFVCNEPGMRLRHNRPGRLTLETAMPLESVHRPLPGLRRKPLGGRIERCLWPEAADGLGYWRELK